MLSILAFGVIAVILCVWFVIGALVLLRDAAGKAESRDDDYWNGI